MVGSDIFDFSIFHPYLEQISNLTHIFSAGSISKYLWPNGPLNPTKCPKHSGFFLKQICPGVILGYSLTSRNFVSSTNSTWNDFCRSQGAKIEGHPFFDGHFWERPLKWCENSYQEKFTKTKKMGSNWPLTNSATLKQMDVWKMTSTVFLVFWPRALKVLRNCVPATSNDSSHQLRRLVTSASASVPSAPASLVSNLR